MTYCASRAREHVCLFWFAHLSLSLPPWVRFSGVHAIVSRTLKMKLTFKKQYFFKVSVEGWQRSNHRVSMTAYYLWTWGNSLVPLRTTAKWLSTSGELRFSPGFLPPLHLNKLSWIYVKKWPIHCIISYRRWLEFVLYLCGHKSPFLWFVLCYLNQLPTFLPSPSLRTLKTIQLTPFSQKLYIHKEFVQMFPGWSYAAAKTLLIIKCKMDCFVIETLWGSDTFGN